jgi:hypothetical protein
MFIFCCCNFSPLSWVDFGNGLFFRNFVFNVLLVFFSIFLLAHSSFLKHTIYFVFIFLSLPCLCVISLSSALFYFIYFPSRISHTLSVWVIQIDINYFPKSEKLGKTPKVNLFNLIKKFHANFTTDFFCFRFAQIFSSTKVKYLTILCG